MSDDTGSQVDHRTGRQEPSAQSVAVPAKTHAGRIGSGIALYAVVDAYLIGIPAFLLSAYTNTLLVFLAVLGLQLVVNLAAGSWIDRTWDEWSADGVGSRFEKKLEKVRKGRIGSRVVDLVKGGSDLGFAVAAMLVNAIVVIALARAATGKPVGHARVVAAALGYALFFAAIFSVLGWAFRDFLLDNL